MTSPYKHLYSSYSAVFVLITVSIIVVVFVHLSARDRILEYQQSKIERVIASETSYIEQSIANAKTKIQFLHATPPIKGIVRASQNNGIDPYDGTTKELWIQRLQIIFEAFLKHNEEVFQARVIGIADEGLELVRVERQNNDIVSLVDERLQTKGHRPYFQQIASQPPGQTYISTISLNREYGQVSQPETPTIRFGMPIYDQEQNIFGMIIINVDASLMLQTLSDSVPEEFSIYITNDYDGFLVHPNKYREFEFEFDESSSWQREFPALDWQHSNGQLARITNFEENKEYLMGYDRLRLGGHDRNILLNIMVGLPYETFQAIVFDQSTQSLIVGAAVLLVVIAFVLYYQYNVKKTLAFTAVQAQFEAIVDGSVDAIIAMDADGIVTSWNTSAHDLIGYTGRQAVGQPLVELLFEAKHQQAISAAIAQVLDGVYLEPIPVDILRRSSNRFSASLALSPIKSDAGRVVGVAAIVRDLTELQHAKQNKELLAREVQLRTQELEKARNEALSASTAKSNFIANVSHEIRTPLGGIIGMLRLLRKENPPEVTKRYFEMAENSAQVLARLINDVLDISKIEAGKLDVGCEKFNLLSVISSAISSLAISAEDRKIDIILDTAGVEHISLIGDSTRLRQIITNLAGNAIKFTDHGWVKLTLATRLKEDGSVELKGSVEDTGIGISEQVLSTIFDAFNQGDDKNMSLRGGTGLGLSITRQLCRLMGGDITVISEKGKGSCFSFNLVMEYQTSAQVNWPANVLAGKTVGVVGLLPELAISVTHQLQAWNAESITVVDSPSSETDLGFDLCMVEQSLLDQCRCSGAVIALCNASQKGAVSKHVQLLLKPVLPLELFSALVNVGLADAGADTDITHQSHGTFLGSVDTTNAQGLPSRILVVDDNATNRAVLEGLLADYHVEVVTAEDGAQAMVNLKAAPRPFDLVFMDCQMPVLDGYTATRKIRAGEAGSDAEDVPIIAITAAAMAGDRERCTLAGMNDYITKPVEPESLQRVLSQWLAADQRKQNVPMEGVIKLAEGNQSTDAWDAEKLMNKVNRREKHFNLVVSAFKESTPEKISELKRAMAQADFATAATIAHTLKGAAASLCAPRLQKMMFNVEQQANNKTSSAWPDLIPVIDTEFSILMKQLGKDAAQEPAAAS